MHILFATAGTLPQQQASILARILFRHKVDKHNGGPGEIDADRRMSTACHCALSCAVVATVCSHTCTSLAPCTHLCATSKRMESSPLDCVLALHKSQLMHESTGAHVAGHMRTTSKPTTHVGFWTVCQTSRASFKRSVTAQIACLRSANHYISIKR